MRRSRLQDAQSWLDNQNNNLKYNCYKLPIIGFVQLEMLTYLVKLEGRSPVNPELEELLALLDTSSLGA